MCFTLTCAEAAGWVQDEAGLADAFEAAVLIDAHAIQAHVSDQALVLV